MASSISVTNIDATYPVAGQDNDSQGFRDNFSQIKTQLTTASTEITSLQANKASTNATTSFNGHDVGQANLIDWSQKVNALGTVTSAAINLNSGNVVTLTTGGATTFSFSNFPLEDDGASNVAVKIKVVMTRAADSHTISFPAAVKMPYTMKMAQMIQLLILSQQEQELLCLTCLLWMVVQLSTCLIQKNTVLLNF